MPVFSPDQFELTHCRYLHCQYKIYSYTFYKYKHVKIINQVIQHIIELKEVCSKDRNNYGDSYAVSDILANKYFRKQKFDYKHQYKHQYLCGYILLTITIAISIAMDKGVLISHRSSQKQFFLSKNTQLHFLTALLKRAFHITMDIKGLKHPRGYNIPIQDIFNFNLSQPFELILDEENSDDRSRSETFSQKALTKRSGRKFPPHQKQLNEAKLYIDDFQFFMTEVGSKKTQVYSGIIFFNNRKSASYLGKKILRELIYEFDQLMFFYALHPLKKHTSSILLGETLNFAIFKGTKLIHERQFPQNLNATEQIIGYLKLLVKKGEIPESGEQTTPDKKQEVRRNIIPLNQQRSFDVKIRSDLEMDFDLMPNKLQKHKTEIQKSDVLTHKSDISPIAKIQSPMKSQITNEINQISFENDLYQPEWFSQGEHLSRLQKSFLSALIKTGDQIFISFCHGLDLKNKQKQSLNIELVKVFLKDFINKSLKNFTEQQRYLIQLNQQNRQSQVFSLLLKLNKFGNIQDFITNINKHMESLLKTKQSYVELARQIQKRRSTGIIRLKKQDQDDDQPDDHEVKLKLIGKQEKLNEKYTKIANSFHKSAPLMTAPSKIPALPSQFTESEKAIIITAILNKDPFFIQNYIPSKWPKKKFAVLKPAIVKKFLVQNQKRFGKFRSFPFNEDIKKKLAKLQQFNSLLYYLYKQRTINKKQKIGFQYLYIWSDLNILACFELYCFDRNLQDLIETFYTIDYTYYLEDRYGIDPNEVQNFTVEIIMQFVILFLLGDHLENIEQKTTIEKYIRAGDNSFMNALSSSKDEKELIANIIKLVEQKRQKLHEIEKQAETDVKKLEKKKKQMKIFVESIRPVHFKQFKKLNLIYDCIELDQPNLHSMFELYYSNNEIVDWIDTFSVYIVESNLKDVHMKTILRNLCTKYNMEFSRLMLARTDMVQGIYESYMVTKDQADTVQTLERVIKAVK